MNGHENVLKANQVTISELAEILTWQLVNGDPHDVTLVVGPPGIGKSSLANQIAAKLDMDAITRHPGNEEPTDEKGFPFAKVVDGDIKADHVIFEDWEKVLTATKPTYVICDDFGQATPATQAAYMPIFLDRTINGRKIPDCVRFIVITNSRKDRANVSGILLPIISRCLGGVYELIPDYKASCDYFRTIGMPQELVGFIRWKESEQQSMLFDPNPPKEIAPYFCPRTIESIGRLQLKGVPKHLELTMFAARTGEAWAREYVAFLGIFRELVMPEAIIANPDGASIPDLTSKNGPATMFAICGALVKRLTKENFGSIMKYAARLAPEFGQFLVDDCTHKIPALMNTPEYNTWAVKRSKSNVGLV